MARSCVIIGSGRAGGSFHAALSDVGWSSELIAARPLVTRARLEPEGFDQLEPTDPDEPKGSGVHQLESPGVDTLEPARVDTVEPSGVEASEWRGSDALEPSGRGALKASGSGTVETIEVEGREQRGASSVDALDGVDLVLLAVPDAAIADVAQALPPTDAVVAHVSGACDLDVLSPHRRVGSIHPLMSLPDAATGRRRLLDSCTFAVDGDALMSEVVAALGGRAIHVPAPSRPLYHATAAIAANHLTALCAQVESLAAQVGVPVDAYWTMMRSTLDNVADVGPAAALTGPAARADWDTIRAHLTALPTTDDRTLYRALCEHAAHLAGNDVPDWLTATQI